MLRFVGKSCDWALASSAMEVDKVRVRDLALMIAMTLLI